MEYSNKQEANPLTEGEIIEIGHITHFFSKISVAVVELSLPLVIGDRILIKGPSTDFEQTVESMQIDRVAIPRAEGGQSIGLKVVQPAKEKDVVYKKL
jgi:putative protease